jgi:hypothetical protein
MVLFDATMLSLWLSPNAKAPTDADGKIIPNVQARVDFLIETLSKSRTKIIIPTPALAEFLVLVGDAGPKYLHQIHDKACFRIVEFDQRAAIEVAQQLRAALKKGKKGVAPISTWAKVKFDHQIVAIAKVEGVSVIYSDDRPLATFAKQQDIATQGINDLPNPPMKQMSINYEQITKTPNP